MDFIKRDISTKNKIIQLEKIQIITYAHHRPDFIEIQYQSIVDNIKDDFEYIVFNNSVDDENKRNEIRRICEKLNVKCVDVNLDNDLRYHGGECNFTDNFYSNFNLACSYPLVWTFKKYLGDNEYVCIIDSDMFFISKISLLEMVRDVDAVYIPQWRDGGNIQYLWNAFIILNLKKNPSLKTLDWHPGYINSHRLDVGGQTHHFIKNNPLKGRYLTEFSIRDISDVENGEMKVHYIQDGSVNYTLMVKNSELTSFEQTDGHLRNFSDFRSFPHEEERLDFKNYILERCLKIIGILDSSGSNLPKPEHIAFIGSHETDEFYILHYKSGSNYLDFSTDEYNSKKTEGSKKIIEHLKKI